MRKYHIQPYPWKIFTNKKIKKTPPAPKHPLIIELLFLSTGTVSKLLKHNYIHRGTYFPTTFQIKDAGCQTTAAHRRAKADTDLPPSPIKCIWMRAGSALCSSNTVSSVKVKLWNNRHTKKTYYSGITLRACVGKKEAQLKRLSPKMEITLV